MSKVLSGQFVKVYTGTGSRFGEVLGITSDGKLLLNPRSELQNIPLDKIHHFRDFDQVIFANPEAPMPTAPTVLWYPLKKSINQNK